MKECIFIQNNAKSCELHFQERKFQPKHNCDFWTVLQLGGYGNWPLLLGKSALNIHCN